ncbi:hypothetical protein D1BOALGB6SA_4835 [Olavius sp. associated proteobacterium Delta 1]|nr:hypothetical protein D1BOALGB6SA_4835 [Olavius sp. associated proteobacterium Delta 1]
MKIASAIGGQELKIYGCRFAPSFLNFSGLLSGLFPGI